VKKGLVILSILLTSITAAFSQELRLVVSGEPLNIVLNSLNVEISFDEKALSNYRVSVSKTFKTPEEAVNYLLKDKPFRIEKIGNVFVIVPVNNNNPSQMQQTAINEPFVFNGTVTDSLNRQPLEYVAVSLLNADTAIITTGITNDKGRFRIETKTIPHLIKISYLGYKTLIDKVLNLNEEWSEFTLSVAETLLPEVVATASHTELNAVKYNVTPQMCSGAANALELLGKIPELHYDKLSDKVIINRQDNVLLLVDGVQHSQHFLRHLSPGRVRSVEVVRSLSGRFVSDDYDAIVQLVLQKDYAGFDMNLSSKISLNLTKTGNYLTENSPDLGIIYTADKFNFFGTYSYSREKWNMQSTKELTCNSSEFASFPEKSPNDLSNYESHILAGGINYHVTPLQFIGAHVDCSSGNADTRRIYGMQNNGRISVNTTEIGACRRTYQNAG
jgi:hypothetical protein